MTQPNYPPYMHPAPQRPKRNPLILVMAIAFAVVAFCGLVGVMVANNAGSAAPEHSTVADEASGGAPGSVVATLAAAPVVKTWTAGQYEVGPDIAPGTYVTVANGPCYWARLSAFDGEFDSIIANDLIKNGTRARVTVKKGDKGVEFTGRCEWTKK
jgi:hypothetical protein